LLQNRIEIQNPHGRLAGSRNPVIMEVTLVLAKSTSFA
jgi:hypothetical protein